MPSATCPLAGRVAATLADPTARLAGELAAHLPRCAACRRAATDAVRNWPPERSPSPSLAEWLAAASGDATLLSPFQAEAVARGQAAALELGPYLLLDRLGAGGMGEVYRAWHRLLRRQDAVKRVRPEVAGNPKAVRRFLREAEAAAKLRHPNVVHVYAADRAGTEYYLAMEFVPGTDLGRLVASDGPLPVATACELVRQAADGLHHAYTHGLVHRDIKPNNLLLRVERRNVENPAPGLDLTASRPDDLSVKVADFGLARALDPSDDASELTAAGAFLGSSDYMPPEQAEDPRAADTRSDIYALGCTLFFLLTGQPPFPGGSLREKLNRHATVAAPPLSAFRSDVPPAVEAVLRKCLAKRPDERFQTPGELAQGLRSAVVGAPTLTAVVPDPASEPLSLPEEPSSPELHFPAAQSNQSEETRGDLTRNTRRASRPRAGSRLLLVAAGVALLVVAVGVVVAVQTMGERKPDGEVKADPPKTGPEKVEPMPGPKPGPKRPAATESAPLPSPGGVGPWKFVAAYRNPEKRDRVLVAAFLSDGNLFAAREGVSPEGDDSAWWEIWVPRGTRPKHEHRFLDATPHEQVVGLEPVGKIITDRFRRWSLPTYDFAPPLSADVSKYDRGTATGLDCVAIPADGKSVVGGVAPEGENRKARLVVKWKSESGEIETAWSVDTAHDLKTLAADRTGDTTVTGTDDGKVVVFRTGEKAAWREWSHTGEPGRKLAAVRGVAVSPGGTRVYSAHDEDRLIHVWDVDGKKELAGIPIAWQARRLAVSPDDRWLLAVGDAVTVWNLRANPPEAHELARSWAGELRSAEFSPDGKRMIVGGAARPAGRDKDVGVVWVWELKE